MNWKRILMGKCSFHYCKYSRWFSVSIDRYWSGRLIYVNVSRLSLHVDCRINFVKDMITGTPE